MLNGGRTILFAVAACCTMVAVQSFSNPNCSSGDGATKKWHLKHAQFASCEPIDGTAAELVYGMGGVNLAKRWMELVTGGHVTATTVLKDGDGNGLRVRYGVKLEEGQRQEIHQRLLEFVEILDEGERTDLRDRIDAINATLADMQRTSEDGEGSEAAQRNGIGLAIQCAHNGPYAAQLQLVRTLRPPRSKDMSSDVDERPSCQPPPYDASKDSFLVGALRLFGHGSFHGDGEPRERAARLTAPEGRYWDVYHNISPVDPRGHYLLLPAIDDESEWRDQSLSPYDCYDVTQLASTIEPPGSMVLSFNSVGAGASQNHIHLHAWVCPPPPLLERDDAAEFCNGYAVANAPLSTSIPPLILPNGVLASMLEYPCTCIKLSADIYLDKPSSPTLKEFGWALSRIVGVAQTMRAPHNVAWTNKPHSSNIGAVTVDVYVFFREKEGSLAPGEMVRGGASELMGVFHSSSKEQLDSLSNEGIMRAFLSDVAMEPRESIWKEVCRELGIEV